jgi:hypothetical protein
METLVAAAREIGLEVSADKTKYMVMSRDQNAGRIHSVRMDNRTFERAEEFKYLGTTLTNQSSIAEEIKSRLRSRNACYRSVQNLLSSRLLSKDLKIKIYKTIILFVVLYGCETWSLALREERKPRVFDIELGIKFRWGQDFPHPSRPALGPTQPTIQWVPCLSWG